MKKNEPINNSRRGFIRNSALALAGFTIVPRHVLGRGFVAPSDKLQVAGIGAGGKGESDLWNFFKSGKSLICGRNPTHLVFLFKYTKNVENLYFEKPKLSANACSDF